MTILVFNPLLRRRSFPRTLWVLSLCVVLLHCVADAQRLRVLTINVWSGLDYVGQSSVGEYEALAIRDQRTRLLVNELKRLRPDIVALQEANPVSTLGSALAEELDYDCIYQRVNSGIKIGGIGLPRNLNEGLVILAKKAHQLQLTDVWDLSDSFGVIGNAASLHFSERRIALVGKIRIGSAEIYVANVHLSSVVPDDSSTRAAARRIVSTRPQNEQLRQALIDNCFVDAGNRMRSAELILERLNGEYADRPMIILGDFNASPSLPEIARLREEGALLDVAEAAGIEGLVTWDPDRNSNINFSRQPVDARGDSLSLDGQLSAWFDGRPRRIDYVFLNRNWKRSDITAGQIVLDRAENGLFPSDHYGFLADLDASSLVAAAPRNPDRLTLLQDNKFEALPILSYDTDVGLGYGAKAFFLNFLGSNESFDLIAFNSTKGERWYRLVFSWPDFELRQGKIYPLSFDLTVDYDKYLRNNFYGVGRSASDTNRETYTKAPLEIQGVLSRGFSPTLIVQLGLKYRTVLNDGYEPASMFSRTLPAINRGRSSALTLYASARYDSRDSYINPSRGQVAQVELETGGSRLLGDYSLTGGTFALQTYNVLFYPKTVFAARLWGQVVDGSDLPVHVLASVGGNKTLRGYPQDRFLDKAAMGFNGEVRFPIYWRFGGVIGVDVASVFSSPAAMTLSGWATNPVLGLRLYMDTFVVRADLGFGNETTGFYLNFGQLF